MKIPSQLRFIPFATHLKREVRRFMRVLMQTLATPLISTLLYLLIFGVSIGGQIGEVGSFNYLAFIIPGLTMMATLRNAFENSSSSIVIMKFCGELEDLKIVPLSTFQIIWANTFGGLIRGVIVGLLTLVAGLFFYYGAMSSFLPLAHPFYFLIFLILGGLSFANMGLAVAMLSKSFEQVTVVNSFILLPLIYLGGVFFSLEHLHPFWIAVSKLNPLLYMIDGVRFSILGSSDLDPLFSFSISLITFAFFHGTAYLALKKGNYSRW